jgi:hypothetical protein
LLIPFLGLPGLILGIITATKPRRGGHGAAIICLSVVLAIVGWVIWASIAFNDVDTSYDYSY